MSMFPIASVTVGAGGQSTISFTSIPQTFTHLQVRGFGQSNRGTYGVDDLKLTINSDTGSNYSFHYLQGNGSAAQSGATASTSGITMYSALGTSVSGTWWGSSIIDILDYTNTNKYKTTRSLVGADLNGTIAGGGGNTGLFSGLWMNTNAITSITLAPGVGTTFSQYTTFQLYGIQSSPRTGA